MSKHTMLPWHVERNGSYEPTINAPHSDKTGYGAAAHDVGIETHSVASVHGPNFTANAAFIVRAVNNHDSLVEALQNLLAEVQDYTRSDGVEDSEAVVAARAAIAKAEGGI